MRSLRNQAGQPGAMPFLADDVLEFHAARLLLLFAICGTNGSINGLTKMAKLDFFVRYPDFFEAAIASDMELSAQERRGTGVEAAMIRHRYGPWDKRYYHVLGYLEASDLISVRKTGRSVRLSLTRAGRSQARRLRKEPAFDAIDSHMERVARAFAAKTGNELKTLIYRLFDKEVARKPLGHVIT
jgi:hypothetical protein